MTKENTGMMYWGYLFSDHEIYPVGWYDMTDWTAGWDKLFADVTQMAEDLGVEPVHAIRGDCIQDLIEDLVILMKDMKEPNNVN